MMMEDTSREKPSPDEAAPQPVSEDEPVPDPDVPTVAADVPEANAIEQQELVLPTDTSDEPDAIPDDAAEADALDQARTVPLDDDTAQ